MVECVNDVDIIEQKDKKGQRNEENLHMSINRRT